MRCTCSRFMKAVTTPIMLSLLAWGTVAYAGETAAMQIQRLGWAGVKLQLADVTLLIDPLETDLWNGKVQQDLVPVTVETTRVYALITHLHNDHFDPDTLRRVLGERGRIICHEDIATNVAAQGFRIISAKMFEPVVRGDISIIAVPASDGFNDRQVSWIVSAGGRRIIHAGDTLWHGGWQDLGTAYGPFDIAFLPVNAPLLPSPSMPGGIRAVMTPEQAVVAARLLKAGVMVPIHYGVNVPGEYEEYPDLREALDRAAAEYKINVRELKPGQWLD